MDLIFLPYLLKYQVLQINNLFKLLKNTDAIFMHTDSLVNSKDWQIGDIDLNSNNIVFGVPAETASEYDEEVFINN
jgi:hypothetical protein